MVWEITRIVNETNGQWIEPIFCETKGSLDLIIVPRERSKKVGNYVAAELEVIRTKKNCPGEFGAE